MTQVIIKTRVKLNGKRLHPSNKPVNIEDPKIVQHLLTNQAIELLDGADGVVDNVIDPALLPGVAEDLVAVLPELYAEDRAGQLQADMSVEAAAEFLSERLDREVTTDELLAVSDLIEGLNEESLEDLETFMTSAATNTHDEAKQAAAKSESASTQLGEEVDSSTTTGQGRGNTDDEPKADEDAGGAGDPAPPQTLDDAIAIVAAEDPRDKGHWTNGGEPDANYLREILPKGVKVTAKLRTEAWNRYQAKLQADAEASTD